MMKGDILEGRPDPAGLQALAEACFPGEDVSDPRYLRWLYEENPVRPATELVTKSGRVVSGHIAGVPLRYRLAGADVLGGLAVNAITHPDHRGKGIFVVLHAEVSRLTAAKDILFLFGFANPNSEKGCLRHLNYHDLGRFPLWILPLRLGSVVKAQDGIPRPVGSLGSAVGAPFLGLWRAIRRPRRKGHFTIEKIGEFGPEFDDSLGGGRQGLCEHRGPGREVPALEVRPVSDAPLRHLRRPFRRPLGGLPRRNGHAFRRIEMGHDRGPVCARFVRREGRGRAGWSRRIRSMPERPEPTSPAPSCSATRPPPRPSGGTAM